MRSFEMRFNGPHNGSIIIEITVLLWNNSQIFKRKAPSNIGDIVKCWQLTALWFMAAFIAPARLNTRARQSGPAKKVSMEIEETDENAEREPRKRRRSARKPRRIAINRLEMMMFYRNAHSCDNDALKSLQRIQLTSLESSCENVAGPERIQCAVSCHCTHPHAHTMVQTS